LSNASKSLTIQCDQETRRIRCTNGPGRTEEDKAVRLMRATFSIGQLDFPHLKRGSGTATTRRLGGAEDTAQEKKSVRTRQIPR